MDYEAKIAELEEAIVSGLNKIPDDVILHCLATYLMLLECYKENSTLAAVILTKSADGQLGVSSCNTTAFDAAEMVFAANRHFLAAHLVDAPPKERMN